MEVVERGKSCRVLAFPVKDEQTWCQHCEQFRRACCFVNAVTPVEGGVAMEAPSRAYLFCEFVAPSWPHHSENTVRTQTECSRCVRTYMSPNGQQFIVHHFNPQYVDVTSTRSMSVCNPAKCKVSKPRDRIVVFSDAMHLWPCQTSKTRYQLNRFLSTQVLLLLQLYRTVFVNFVI